MPLDPCPRAQGGPTNGDTRVRRPRDQDNERGDKALPLPHIAIDGPLEEGSPSHCTGTDAPSPCLGGEVLPRSATEVLPRDATEVLPRDATIKTTVPPSCDEMTRDAALPDRKKESALDRNISLEKGADHNGKAGKRLTDPGRTLLDRLRPAPEKGKRALMERMEVWLKDRISTLAVSGHKRAHNRPKKRLERLLRLEEEILREREEFQWTDAEEIDWYIDQEESLPVRSDDDDNEDRMDVD
ncbi:hypothetical protein B0H14DRAFT_2595729 [Mycena olivaceomarginata]|nr:hypothetical protein B0H14DRAFT_2595729 [Mycena olivaceomarginata]